VVSFVLDQAAESNTAEAVSMLLRFGADPFLRNRDGKLPRELTNEPAVLELLREGGGDTGKSFDSAASDPET